MAAQDEVERLDLLRVRLTSVERLKRFHRLWAADGRAPNGNALCKRQRRRGKVERSAHDPEPRQRDPAPIVALRIGRIHEMTEAMLRPAILALLAVIDATPQEGRLAVAIAQEERVTLSRDRQAPELPLLLGLRIEVVVFDFENRVFDRGAIVRVQPLEEPHDRAHLFPR